MQFHSYSNSPYYKFVRDKWSSDRWVSFQSDLENIGLLPWLGEPADLVNSGISAIRGKYAEASINAAAAVPVLGWLATAFRKSDKLYEVYHLINIDTQKIEYVGITSQGILSRFNQYLLDRGKQAWIHNVEPVLLKGSLSKLDARILEQKEIIRLGLDNLKNKINSIAEKHWKKHGL